MGGAGGRRRRASRAAIAAQAPFRARATEPDRSRHAPRAGAHRSPGRSDRVAGASPERPDLRRDVLRQRGAGDPRLARPGRRPVRRLGNRPGSEHRASAARQAADGALDGRLRRQRPRLAAAQRHRGDGGPGGRVPDRTGRWRVHAPRAARPGLPRIREPDARARPDRDAGHAGPRADPDRRLDGPARSVGGRRSGNRARHADEADRALRPPRAAHHAGARAVGSLCVASAVCVSPTSARPW